MASVSIPSLILSDAASPSDDQMLFPLMASLSITAEVPGENRRYASGTVRSVSRRGRTKRASATLPACTRAQVAWLEDHLGRLLLVRDDRGTKFYGNYREIAVSEHRYNKEADVTVSLSEVTYPE